MQTITAHRQLRHRFIGLALLCIFANTASAQTTQVESDDFGRLFSKPDQRAALDHQRKLPNIHKPKQKRIKKRSVAISKPKPAIVRQLPAPITLQGYVKRSDGPNTVWINKQPVQENTTINHVKIGRLTNKTPQKQSIIKGKQKLAPIDQLVINIPANGKNVKLKAGQGYNAEYNEVSEITSHLQHHRTSAKPLVADQ